MVLVVLVALYRPPCFGHTWGTLRGLQRKPPTAWEEVTFSWGLSGKALSVFQVSSG